MAKTADWDALRHEFLKEGLRRDLPERFTLKHLSERHNLSYGYVRIVAAKQEWAKQLQALAAVRDAQAVEAVKDLTFVTEVEVRLRQANFSRVAVDKAMQKIQLLEPEDLTVKDAIALLHLGLEQERKALGIPEAVTIQATSAINDGERTAVQQAMAIIRTLRPPEAALEGEVVERNDD